MAERRRQTQRARELAAQGRSDDTEVAHVARGEYVIPEALQTPEVVAALQRAAADYGVPLARLNVGNAMNSINPETGAPEFSFGNTVDANSGTTHGNHPIPGTQMALNWWQKKLITDDMKNGIKGTLRGLTNGALPDTQIDSVYDQLIDNIPFDDARKLALSIRARTQSL